MTVTCLRLDDVDSDVNTRRILQDISSLVAKRRRIVVVTGAGISCSSGIPDFRSSDGLYNMLQQRHPDVLLKGSDLFDASLFRDAMTHRLFLQFIAELKTSIDNAEPSPTHHFIQTLNAKGRLLRSYTQNIDGFEERLSLLGSSSENARFLVNGRTKIKVKEIRNVQLHGDIHRLRCEVCYSEYPCSAEFLEMLRQGSAPSCRECVIRCEDRVARAARSLRIGLLRPAIVLYSEHHPFGDDIGEMCSTDLARKPDLLLIMGTSLKVHGVKKLVKEFARAVHERPGSKSSRNATAGGRVIFINKSPPGAEWADYIDYHVQGETDDWVLRAMDDWRRIRPTDFETQTTLSDHFDAMKLTKASTPTLPIRIPPFRTASTADSLDAMKIAKAAAPTLSIKIPPFRTSSEVVRPRLVIRLKNGLSPIISSGKRPRPRAICDDDSEGAAQTPSAKSSAPIHTAHRKKARVR